MIAVGLLTLADTAAAAQSTPDTNSGAAAWDPWTELNRMRQEMDRAFEDSLQRMHAGGIATAPVESITTVPNTTLNEEKEDYVVTAKLPGVESGDLNVSLDGRLLRISAQSHSRHEEQEDNGKVVSESEFDTSIQRALTLPGPVDASKMHTQFDNGVLTVTIPKATL
jgi:HSP20 family protein